VSKLAWTQRVALFTTLPPRNSAESARRLQRVPRRTSYSGPARLPWSAWRNSYASHPAWQLSQRTCTRPTPGGPAPLVVTFGPGPVSLAPQPCPTLVTDAAARPTDSTAAISSSCATVSLARQAWAPGPRGFRVARPVLLFKFQVVCPSESRPAARPLAPAHSRRRDNRACLTSLYPIEFHIDLLLPSRRRVGSWPRACSRAALASGCVTSFRVSYPRSRVHVVTPVPTSCRPQRPKPSTYRAGSGRCNNFGRGARQSTPARL